jgi:hypothetical protein
MKSTHSSSRPAAQLSPTLHKNLNSYALGAAAIGAAVLAAPQPAAAEIIYTATNQHIHDNLRFDLDLNGDGITDFILVNRLHISTTPFGDDLSILPAANGNGFIGRKQAQFSYGAAALPLGAHVGPDAPFIEHQANLAFASSSTDIGGPWVNAKNRYLGLKFMINGEVHYGWARLTVRAYLGTDSVQSDLTGYAYETIPNQPIEAGQMSNSADSRSSDEASIDQSRHDATPSLGQTLGSLALGSVSLSLWRKGE